MKIIRIVFLVFIIIACTKGNDKKYPENPDWLTDKISQMETPAEYEGTVIYAYVWHNEYYYLISLPLSSCGMCEFYNYKGIKYEWTPDRIDDFQKNATRLKVVWQRGIV